MDVSLLELLKTYVSVQSIKIKCQTYFPKTGNKKTNDKIKLWLCNVSQSYLIIIPQEKKIT